MLATRRVRTVENIMGKGENAGFQHVYLFPQCFLSNANSFTSDHFKLSFGKELHVGRKSVFIDLQLFT